MGIGNGVKSALGSSKMKEAQSEAMEICVGVTDNDWYRFLSQLPNVDEVNFWQPLTFVQLRKSATITWKKNGDKSH